MLCLYDLFTTHTLTQRLQGAVLALAETHGLSLLGEVYAIDQGPNAGRRVAYFRDDNGLTLEFLEAA